MCIETIKNDPNLPNVLNGVRMSLLRRAEKCINVDGGHFEQFM